MNPHIVATVYKMNLPFGEGSLYDKTKYFAIIDELERNLKYDWLYKRTTYDKSNAFEVREVYFSWWSLKCIFYYEKNHYFLPGFQIDVYSNTSHLSQKFMDTFSEVFDWMNNDAYICDYIDWVSSKSKLLTENMLSKDFSTFSYKELKKFIEESGVYFIEEKLERNDKIRNWLYYLLYLNYRLFRNILLSDWWIKELEELLWEDIDDNLLWHLSISKERIDHVQNVNIQVFEKYKNLLDSVLLWFDPKK